MKYELLLTNINEILDFKNLQKEYRPLIDDRIRSKLRKGVTYARHGDIGEVKVKDSLLPKIGESILELVPEGIFSGYRIHPKTITFNYEPYTEFRGLDIKDESDALEYRFYESTSKFRDKELSKLDAYRVLGITGILFYSTPEFLDKYSIPLPNRLIYTKFNGGISREDDKSGLIAIIGNSWEKTGRSVVTSSAIAGAHELGHTFKAKHGPPHSSSCIMDLENNVSESTKFCESCVKTIDNYLIQ